MRYCNNAHFVCGNLVDNAIRKPAQNMPSPGSTEHCAEIWVNQDKVDDVLKFGNKSQPQVGSRIDGVKRSGGLQLSERRWNNDEVHTSAARTRAKASAIGMT